MAEGGRAGALQKQADSLNKQQQQAEEEKKQTGVRQLRPQRRPDDQAVRRGLSVAVLLASAMVLSLAPAMLTLLGRAVWWLPR